MHMRKYFMTAFVLAAMLVFATSGLALEKTAVRADRANADGWDAGASCSVTYANICTGWLWVWSGWSPGDRIGVVFDPCCDNGALAATQAYFWTGAPSGYGFTGTLSIESVAGGCPSGVINSHPLLPPAGPVVDFWSAPAGPVALISTTGPGVGNPYSMPTDHPAAGPTGPQSCGSCFPSTRPIHTFYFGNTTTALCPGSALNDGICDSEALFWSAAFTGCTISVEENTWGAVKNLYR
jgi:hypothetical protein